jgi:nucleotide-binding universal stress UspA family protein
MVSHEAQVFRRILAAYDGSPQAQHATKLAISLASAMQSHLLIFAVIRPPEPATRSELNAMLDDAREH